MRIRSMRPDEISIAVDCRASPGRQVEQATRARSWYTYDDRKASVHGFIWSKRVVGISGVHKAGVIAVA